MAFGLMFAGAWAAANETAKGLAAGIATGAKAVGEIPVAMAALENKAQEGWQSAREAVTRTTMAVESGAEITASEWKGAMDVKAAQILQAVGLPVDSNAAMRQAASDTLTTKERWDRERAASDASLQSMRQRVEAANAERNAAAQALKRKIVAKGRAASDAINNARKAADAWIVREAFRKAWATAATVKKAYDAVKSKFSKTPISSPSVPCPTSQPAERLRNQILRQQALLKRAKNAIREEGPNAPLLRGEIPDLENEIETSKKALLAADVYNDNRDGKKDAAPGWDRLSDKQIEDLGLDPNDFHPSGWEFRAGLYRSADGRYSLVYKGTSPTSEQDWENNLLQGLGLKSDYYDLAQQLAKSVYDSKKIGSNMDIVGHSLGGGLASAAVAWINDPRVRGVTFNAAGLNPDTVPNGDITGAAKQIDVYQVDGELLTTAQNYTSKLGISPKAIGETHALPGQPGDGAVDRHSMEGVERGLLETGGQTETNVESLLGSSALTHA